MVIIDVSGSMRGPRIATAKAAAVVVLNTLGPEDRVAVVAFSTNTQVGCNWFKFGKFGLLQCVGRIVTSSRRMPLLLNTLRAFVCCAGFRTLRSLRSFGW